jgi:Holliday junction resolvase-like predicted endonuclease
MKVEKSTRHSKITGDFCEDMILYWLSKYGFECAKVDHTGIDIIARNPHNKEVMGISVKGRSRNEGAEGTYVSIPNDNFDKAEKACEAFNCVPYFAIVVDEKDKIYAFVLSMKHLLKLFPKGDQVCAWKMNEKHVEEYYKDPKIIIFEFDYKTHNWWK